MFYTPLFEARDPGSRPGHCKTCRSQARGASRQDGLPTTEAPTASGCPGPAMRGSGVGGPIEPLAETPKFTWNGPCGDPQTPRAPADERGGREVSETRRGRVPGRTERRSRRYCL